MYIKRRKVNVSGAGGIITPDTPSPTPLWMINGPGGKMHNMHFNNSTRIVSQMLQKLDVHFR